MYYCTFDSLSSVPQMRGKGYRSLMVMASSPL